MLDVKKLSFVRRHSLLKQACPCLLYFRPGGPYVLVQGPAFT